jgi:hypothetical protein
MAQQSSAEIFILRHRSLRAAVTDIPDKLEMDFRTQSLKIRDLFQMGNNLMDSSDRKFVWREISGQGAL